MRTFIMALIVAVAALSLCVASVSIADNSRGGHSGGSYRGDGHDGGFRGDGHFEGHHDGSHFNVMISDPFWYPSWYYPYYYPYYPYYYPTAVGTVPSMPQEYIERAEPDEPAAATSGVWYYCPGSKAYYPYVNECQGGWQTVPAEPPSKARR